MDRSDVILGDFKSETRVVQECKFHGYTGLGSKKKPEYGCEICNFLTFFTLLARKSKTSLNKEALDELEAYITALCELEDEGKFDWVVDTPEFDIQKNATKD